MYDDVEITPATGWDPTAAAHEGGKGQPPKAFLYFLEAQKGCTEWVHTGYGMLLANHNMAPLCAALLSSEEIL